MDWIKYFIIKFDKHTEVKINNLGQGLSYEVRPSNQINEYADTLIYLTDDDCISKCNNYYLEYSKYKNHLYLFTTDKYKILFYENGNIFSYIEGDDNYDCPSDNGITILFYKSGSIQSIIKYKDNRIEYIIKSNKGIELPNAEIRFAEFDEFDYEGITKELDTSDISYLLYIKKDCKKITREYYRMYNLIKYEYYPEI